MNQVGIKYDKQITKEQNVFITFLSFFNYMFHDHRWSGGHTAEMMQIVKHMNYDNYTPRIYVCALTDKISTEKIKSLEGNRSDYKIIKITRSREVGQSYISSVWTTTLAILDSVSVLWFEKPELILCNGPGTCVPLCIIAFLFKIFFISDIITVFIESFCRVETFSLTGKILYYLVDHVIVQWPYLKITIEYTEMTSEAGLTTALINWILLKEDLKYLPIEIKVHLTSIVDVLQTDSVKKLENIKKWITKSLIRIEACLDRTWQILNSGYWKDVPLSYRYSYSFCSLIKIILLEIDYEQNEAKSVDTEINILQQIIQQIDKGILLGAPLPSEPSLLTSIASKINDHYSKFMKTLTAKKIAIDHSKVSQTLLPEFLQVNRYNEPSMESFYKDIFMPKVPAVLTGCMKYWNALHLWQDIDYLNKTAGSRTVPIEIGSHYTEEDWTQNLVTFSEFLQSHVIEGTQKIGYLAQHQLFDQIPELKKDIIIPDYCSFSDTEDAEAEPPDINAWFGPAETVSPLHYDIKNNLLCQVLGYKRIFLYNPSDSVNLYPYDTKLLHNTAQVDPVKPDYIKWPNLKKAKGFMCYLGPGEMLYIPPKWWHHVTALTPSFSVSFWWT
ncbi:hypothetical protein KPH14_012526 [Odynerus spinipes]|uniref:UDP-N-acetylglucosamine transferase subunit ALG14 n=1 Tax=Odynerus spinipes TaxID=1348599 RepID=A0AAD9VMV9_9HYME|nr:hypothetical protein KPH14_012526 [Odynerus spinipes]